MTDFSPEPGNIRIDRWDHTTFRNQDLTVDVLRLDRLHPEISGNKWFKLKYWLEKAKREKKKILISYGGAYSNHLLALAAAAKINGFSSVGIIRGEEPAIHSHLLIRLKDLGMRLRFISRDEYKNQKNTIADEKDPDAIFIPEGGGGLIGVQGAEEIMALVPENHYTHICSAVGTGTTMAGLINSALPHQKIIGISVLKGTHDLEPMDVSWIRDASQLQNARIIHDDHFGGYGKSTAPLIEFMNGVYSKSGIPTDFVYTGKLFYSVERMAAEKYFPAGSRLLILHSGGLEGNRSLAPGLLQF